jgi:hypothetical protein
MLSKNTSEGENYDTAKMGKSSQRNTDPRGKRILRFAEQKEVSACAQASV